MTVVLRTNKIALGKRVICYRKAFGQLQYHLKELLYQSRISSDATNKETHKKKKKKTLNVASVLGVDRMTNGWHYICI